MAEHVAIDAAFVPRIEDIERRGFAVRVGEHQFFVATIQCHPEHREGPAFGSEKQVPRMIKRYPRND
jgi:hypothetical protein